MTHYLESTFVPSVVPQPDEYHAKDQARQYLEKLADQVSPGAKLLPFGSVLVRVNGAARDGGDPACWRSSEPDMMRASSLRSMANGFALKNSGRLL